MRSCSLEIAGAEDYGVHREAAGGEVVDFAFVEIAGVEEHAGLGGSQGGEGIGREGAQ